MNNAEMQRPIFEIPGRPRYGPYNETVPTPLDLSPILAKLTEIAGLLGATPTPGSPGTPPVVSDKIKHLSNGIVRFSVADTEYAYTFPVGTKAFVMHTRGGAAVRLSTEPGVVASGTQDPRFTLKANTAYDQEDLLIPDTGQTFYFACAVAGEVLEIIVGV
jgi:hypothetical protein